MRSKFHKPISVIHRLLPIVVAECLFVKVTEQMKRFDAHIGSPDSALQKTPEVFESVGVNLSIDVLLRMVDYLVRVLLREIVIGLERITVERASGSDVVPHLLLNFR